MKIMYVTSKRKQKNEISLTPEQLKQLPKQLYIVYSIQYREIAESIKKQLDSNKIKVTGFQQVLGCSKVNTNLPILLVGNGKFHARNLFLQAKELYIIDNGVIQKISDSEIDSLRAKRKTALIKFLGSNSTGILISTKPGQENLAKAIRLKEDLKKKTKKAYLFLANNIDRSQFENFNIDSWINTACPGLGLDNSDIINMDEMPKY